jgi:hypothetical protein
MYPFSHNAVRVPDGNLGKSVPTLPPPRTLHRVAVVGDDQAEQQMQRGDVIRPEDGTPLAPTFPAVLVDQADVGADLIESPENRNGSLGSCSERRTRERSERSSPARRCNS